MNYDGILRMYEEFWGLKTKPFNNVPDPKFYYHSTMHDEAYLRLVYTLKENKGAAMLSGDYGCGKTMLIRLLVAEVARMNYEIAYINNPRWTADEMWCEILYEFGEEPVAENGMTANRALGKLLYRNFEQGKNNLVVVDEAQLIKDKTVFEELRLLLNFQLDDHFLVNLFLIGQPELRERVMAIPQLEQRLVIKYHLYAFNLEDTEKYIEHRLRVAGLVRPIFSKEAIEEIYKMTMGSPRRINNLCDICLLLGFRKNKKTIDRGIVTLAK
ncbi:MAG: ExeA family protein [bacterium]